MVRELVAEQPGPVLAEEVEGHEDLGVGLQATGSQGQVDELHQAAALGEGRLGPSQPLGQVKLVEAERVGRGGWKSRGHCRDWIS